MVTACSMHPSLSWWGAQKRLLTSHRNITQTANFILICYLQIAIQVIFLWLNDWKLCKKIQIQKYTFFQYQLILGRIDTSSGERLPGLIDRYSTYNSESLIEQVAVESEQEGDVLTAVALYDLAKVTFLCFWSFGFSYILVLFLWDIFFWNWSIVFLCINFLSETGLGLAIAEQPAMSACCTTSGEWQF